MTLAETHIDRFLARVVVDCACDCFVWTGAVDKDGYGRFSIDGTWYRAHRLAFDTWSGKKLGPLDVDHLCRVRRCVNWAHMEDVTRGTNTLRGEGCAARQARQTHCRLGHPLEGSNLAIEVGPSGGRQRRCITCRNNGQNARRWRRLAAAASLTG